MTDAQAKQINEMRMKGMGYKAIGMAIGLSRDIVRNYCKRHNLAGYATVVSKNMKLIVRLMQYGIVLSIGLHLIW